MKIGKEISEATVIASWLKAESESARFKHLVQKALKKSQLSPALFTQPNLSDTQDNQNRKRLLRLARHNAIKRFPWRYTIWYELEIESKNELAKLYTPFGDTWLAFTYGERTLAKAAEFIAGLPASHDPLKHVLGTQQELANGRQPEPPILVTTGSALSRPLSIVEGNVRLVSYYLYQYTTYPIRAYVGTSPKFATWAHSMDTLEDIRRAFMKQGKNIE